jgi:tellurite resistance protein
MEAILTWLFIIFIFGGWRIIPVIWGAIFPDDSTSGHSTVNHIGPFEAKLVVTRLDPEDSSSPIAWSIQVKGLFPIVTTTNIGFVISVLDNKSEDDPLEPVLCSLEEFQEEDNIVFQYVNQIGEIDPGIGLTGWFKAGAVFPELLEPPYSGQRNLLILVRMIDADNPPSIIHGFHTEGDPGILWQKGLSHNFTFTTKGYHETSAHREEARVYAIKMAMAVAMSDGSFDDAEGNVIKKWIQKIIALFNEHRQQELKEKYNNALKESYEQVKNNQLTLSSLTEKMNGIDEDVYKYEAIELCFDVMAADGVADPEELKVIKNLAAAMELDFEEIEKMKDTKIVGLESNLANEDSMEAILGIEPDWDVGQIKSHLRAEFQKWNNRVNTLPEGDERNSAQARLDLIADARKKHS